MTPLPPPPLPRSSKNYFLFFQHVFFVSESRWQHQIRYVLLLWIFVLLFLHCRHYYCFYFKHSSMDVLHKYILLNCLWLVRKRAAICVCVYYVEAGDNSIVVLIDLLQNSSKCRLLLLFLLLSPTAKKFNTSNERWGRNCISDGKLFAINIIPLQPPYMPHSRFHIETGTLSWATGEMDKNIPTADKDAGVFFLSWRIF